MAQEAPVEVEVEVEAEVVDEVTEEGPKENVQEGENPTENVPEEATSEGEEGKEGKKGEGDPLEEEDLVFSFGDKEPPEEQEHEKAPGWVRELRKAHRETQRENRELKERLDALQNPESKPVVLGEKPTLAGYDYDEEEHDKALSEWYERKRQIEESEREAKQAKQAEEKAWQEQLNTYNTQKEALKTRVKNFDEAELLVSENLNVTQQGIIIQGAKDPAMLIASLGNNLEILQEVAKITDPIKFTFAVAYLEKDMKVKNRKVAPPPETKVEGTGSKSGAVDSTLDKLRADAARTGDYTKVMEYRRRKMQSKK